jgi:hypothetical protein
MKDGLGDFLLYDYGVDGSLDITLAKHIESIAHLERTLKSVESLGGYVGCVAQASFFVENLVITSAKIVQSSPNVPYSVEDIMEKYFSVDRDPMSIVAMVGSAIAYRIGTNDVLEKIVGKTLWYIYDVVKGEMFPKTFFKEIIRKLTERYGYDEECKEITQEE